MDFVNRAVDFGVPRYPKRTIHLEEIQVPNTQLRSSGTNPILGLTTVRVSLTGDRLEPSQAIVTSALNENFLIFGTGMSQNMVTLIQARKLNGHNLLSLGTRAAPHMAKRGGLGFIIGGAVGYALSFFFPPLGIPLQYLTGAGGAGMGAFVGGVEAWKEETATIRVVDYAININKFLAKLQPTEHRPALHINDAAQILLNLHHLGNELGDGGRIIFDELIARFRFLNSTYEQALLQEYTRRLTA